jgi:hypothetical protein
MTKETNEEKRAKTAADIIATEIVHGLLEDLATRHKRMDIDPDLFYALGKRAVAIGEATYLTVHQPEPYDGQECARRYRLWSERPEIDPMDGHPDATTNAPSLILEMCLTASVDKDPCVVTKLMEKAPERSPTLKIERFEPQHRRIHQLYQSLGGTAEPRIFCRETRVYDLA